MCSTTTSSSTQSAIGNGLAPNIRIRENYKKAYETFPDKTFIARTPIVPGVNMTEEHVRGVLDFIKPYKNVVDYELLPYHRYGESKYSFVGRGLPTFGFRSATTRDDGASAFDHR